MDEIKALDISRVYAMNDYDSVTFLSNESFCIVMTSSLNYNCKVVGMII